MRFLPYIFVILLSVFTCCRTSRHAGGYDTIKGLKFQGPVRAAEVMVVKTYAGITRPDTTSVDNYTLDRMGNVLTHKNRKMYIPDSPSTTPTYDFESATYTFDKRGQLVKVTRLFDGTTDLSEIQYGRRKMTATHTCNGKTSKTTSVTDSRGRTVTGKSIRADGSTESQTYYRYFHSGREIEEYYFGKNDVLRLKYIEHQDTVNGDAFHYSSDSGQHNRKSTTITTLNKNGKAISKVEMDDTLGVTTREQRKYDTLGNEVDYWQHDYVFPSDQHITRQYSYDGTRIIKSICSDTLLPGQPREQVRQTIYIDYDEYGNYRKKITTWPKEPSPADTTYEFRTFNYFDR